MAESGSTFGRLTSGDASGRGHCRVGAGSLRMFLHQARCGERLFFGDPFWDRDIDVTTVDKYEAVAEIVLGRGPKPADNVRAFDAREVMRNLGPSIMTPQ